MAVTLNHHIVHARDPEASARFLTEILGLPEPTRFGPFIVVHTAIAAVFFGSLRTRIPVEPVMCVLAAGALLTVARGVRVRRSAPVPPRT